MGTYAFIQKLIHSLERDGLAYIKEHSKYATKSDLMYGLSRAP